MFDKIIQVLVLVLVRSCAYVKVADPTCSATTIRCQQRLNGDPAPTYELGCP